MWAVRARLASACVYEEKGAHHCSDSIHFYVFYVVICLTNWCSTVKGVGAPIYCVFYSYLFDFHLLRVIRLSFKLRSGYILVR